MGFGWCRRQRMNQNRCYLGLAKAVPSAQVPTVGASGQRCPSASIQGTCLQAGRGTLP